jgi:CheY-like chemotaxis protein
VLQSFAEEVEDQSSSPPASAAGSQDYPDRPHDALSRVRSQVNSIKRGLMPLHIPPHVRDLKSRRLSEPVAADDFGNFSYKNLPALERANKDVIQKLRAEAMASQNRSGGGGSGNNSGNALVSPGPYPHAHPSLTSPLPSLEGSPVMANPVQKTLSSVKSSNRPQSPSGISHANSSPSRASQPSSPLLVSFVAGPGSEGRRKASGNSSSFTYDIPRVPPSLQKAATSAAASPVRGSLGRSGSGASSSGAASVASGGAGSCSSNSTATVGHRDRDRDRDGSLTTITTAAPPSTAPVVILASSTRNIGGSGNEARHGTANSIVGGNGHRPRSEKGKDIGTDAGDSCHGTSSFVSPHKSVGSSRQSGVAPTGRCRSLTGGSQPQESSPTILPEGLASTISVGRHRNRMSQVLSDVSPSSSDNEDKHTRLRVHRRRPGSRRMSHVNPPINPDAGPSFRPLDVLICEDHPVSRMVMEKLLEKLRCRTMSVPNGSEAVRYSMSEITFDIIFLEYKLPQINGADVARMIRETKNANAHTPIVAITAYLKELQAPHYFDSLIEKPLSSSKLSEVLRTLCHWRPASPSRVPSMASLTLSLPARPVTSTTSAAASFYVAAPSSASISVASSTTGVRQSSSLWSGGNHSPTYATASSGRIGGSNLVSVASRADSISSSLCEDTESVMTDDVPIVISRRATGDWEDGLGIKDDDALTVDSTMASSTTLVATTVSVSTAASAAVTTTATGTLVDQFLSNRVTSLTGQESAPTYPEQRRMSPFQRPVERPKDDNDRVEKRPTESGSTDSIDDANEETGSSAVGDGGSHQSDSRQPFRPRTVKGASKGVFLSSKLGIEMMRADSHDRMPQLNEESGQC